jgi:hypothetical protein
VLARSRAQLLALESGKEWVRALAVPERASAEAVHG